MHRAAFLLITAVGEGVTGLFLLLWPAVPLALLLGVQAAAPETLLVARVAGTALIAIGRHERAGARTMPAVRRCGPCLRASWSMTSPWPRCSPTPGSALQLGGILLWPAVWRTPRWPSGVFVCLHLTEQPMRADGA